MKKIAPSVLSADFSRLGEEIRAVEAAGADLIHLDVMDGHFVPNITAGPILVEAARKVTNLPLDTHLMIESPERYIPDFIDAGANLVSIHVEVHSSPAKLKKNLRLIRAKGAKASIALNPKTPLSKILSFLDEVDMILVMTVNPGFGGQSFVPSCLKKIRKLRMILDQRECHQNKRQRRVDGDPPKAGIAQAPMIEVDGGIKIDNIGQVSEMGANVFVAGSAIFKSSNYQKTISEMKSKA